MFLHSIRSQQLATLAGRVSAADEATPELLSGIVAGTVRRPSARGEAARLHQLIEAGALTEAAFAVINLELPLWQIRRITYDEGEWHCAMSAARTPRVAGPGDRDYPFQPYARNCQHLHRNASAN